MVVGTGSFNFLIVGCSTLLLCQRVELLPRELNTVSYTTLLDCRRTMVDKEIHPVGHKPIRPKLFKSRTDAEAFT